VIHGGKLAEGFSAANVHHHDGAPNATPRGTAKLRKFGDQIDGQIINTIEAQILKRLED
jgi:hypothetical protein